MKCHLCDGEAVAVFWFDKGCYCDEAQRQPLCLHHAYKSGPAKGGTMELIEDLSADGEFSRRWCPRPSCEELLARM
jgi:hypothetical protein